MGNSDAWFLNPDDSHRGTDFWMLNDALSEGEMRAQMRAMRAQGIASVIVRTYVGLRSDYPGEDFMSKMRVVVDEARALNMTLFMQAGYMPEAVLDLPVEYSLKSINPYPAGEGGGVLLDSYEGVDYRAEPTYNILDMLSPDASRFYVMQSYENMWKDFKAEFGKTIVSMWVDEPSYRRATLPWTDALPDAFRALWGYEFPLDKLHLLFVEGEGAHTLRYRFWRTVLHLIKSAYFSEVRAWCKANGVMFSGHLMAEETMDAQICATCFTMPLYKYFDLPGIDYLTCDLNWRYGEIKPDTTRNMADMFMYTTALQCTSAAHQAGQERILCEMYGVSSENLSLRDQKHIFDRFAVTGVNHRSVHGIFYSLRGRGKRAYPPHVNVYQPYWEKYNLLTDTVARESAFIRRAKPVRDALVIHPMDSAFCEYRPKRLDGAPNAPLVKRDRAFLELIKALSGVQINYELGDEDTIAEMACAVDGALKIGEMSYRTVILPDMLALRKTTLDVLKAFALMGGRVIALGALPYLLDGEPDANLERAISELPNFYQAADFCELVKQLSRFPRSYTYETLDDASAVQIYYGERENEKLCFMVNSDCREARNGVLRLPGEFDAYALNARRGTRAQLVASVSRGETRVSTHIPEGGSLMIVFTPARNVLPTEQARASSCALINLDGEWELKREDPNTLVLEFARYSLGGAPYSKQYPILGIQSLLTKREYKGDISLEFAFETEIGVRGARLALESPEKWEISLDSRTINVQPHGYYRAFAFETVALPDIEPGKHTIVLSGHFEPLAKPTNHVTAIFQNLGGVELEPILLLGDFAVKSLIEPGVAGCVRFNPHFYLTSEPARVGDEIVSTGYPFYAGVMRLKRTFSLDCASNRRVEFALDGLRAACAEVFVNGVNAGDLCWSPYRIDITELVREGENELEIVLYNTLRNLLGPWHRPVGEMGSCWGNYAHPNKPWLGAVDGDETTQWMECRVPDNANWTESYLMLPMGVARAHILISERG